jgi:pSer/pThr/pTyr-binding forkhead associated (FHA) protein
MIQLAVLSGKLAGSTSVARRFPFEVGRASDADLVLPEPGVWDRHLVIKFEPGNGFLAAAQGEALMTVNGEPTRGTRLRNGDSIEIGGVRLQFQLGDPRQGDSGLREWFVWFGIAFVTAAQFAIIYLLVR